MPYPMTGQKATASSPANTPLGTTNPALDAWSYWVDAWQRGVLFLDVMEQRSKQYEEHAAKPAPHFLKFGVELVMDGRKLPRPVNYVLARIVQGSRTAVVGEYIQLNESSTLERVPCYCIRFPVCPPISVVEAVISEFYLLRNSIFPVGRRSLPG
jgi:Protein of unknown function (DUF3141)